MPLPLLFIGVAAIAGVTGVGTTVKAVDDKNKAHKITRFANKRVQQARDDLEEQLVWVSEALENLGKEKVEILEGHVKDFIATFEKLKNVDFRESLGLNEIKNLHIDKKDFEELKALSHLAVDLSEGLSTGMAAGALTAFGAYQAAGQLALASTGTAISSLSGAAASNATLAFFGGGSLASGGLGMAGGTMVLGGLVAGPALLVMGLVVGVKSQVELDKALANQAQAMQVVEELRTLSLQCSAIRRRTLLFYELLARLDIQFAQLISDMNRIVDQEGEDYATFLPTSKRTIAMAATMAATIKAVLDTPILNGDGDLTDESKAMADQMNTILAKMSQ